MTAREFAALEVPLMLEAIADRDTPPERQPEIRTVAESLRQSPDEAALERALRSIDGLRLVQGARHSIGYTMVALEQLLQEPDFSREMLTEAEGYAKWFWAPRRKEA